MENVKQLWVAVLEDIEDKISKPSFDTWLKNTEAEKLVDDTLIITVPNNFARDWLEGRYTKLITDLLLELTGAELSIKFVIPDTFPCSFAPTSIDIKKMFLLIINLFIILLILQLLN